MLKRYLGNLDKVQISTVVLALGEELGVAVRFKPVLPLGRADDIGLTPTFFPSLDDDAECIANTPHPTATCGLGMNLYVAPNGECFPCYALMGSRHYLGNAIEVGLAPVLARNDFYRRFTVDTNNLCRNRNLRYICGGFCRAWSDYDDPDAPPKDYFALYERAGALLFRALEVLEVNVERWLEAGLPIPQATQMQFCSN